MTSHETERETETETETEAESESEADGHGAGLAVTTAAFTFLLLRLFAVSGYDWHTAFAVLHTLDLDDTIGLVLGTVMADSFVSVLFLALLLPVAVLRFFTEARALREARNRAQMAGRRAERPDLTGAMLLGAATITTPWVPLERIELGHAKGLRGYVMQAEPGFLKVLTEREREFLILPDDDVRSREEIAAH
ncbi:hypothetical protein AB0N81_32265 [Streptomyces sp. NPDC093510]|uniref:hypothetical protein n=1 Tax=Streptomyces sp. NPDC093510 TaxID=3155199 RepID=UPI0034255C66